MVVMHIAYLGRRGPHGGVGYRTTIVLDDESRAAARALASAYGCSMSEAIRRAVIEQRRLVGGVSAARVAERQRTLEELFRLFDGHDAEAEVAHLKAEDEGE